MMKRIAVVIASFILTASPAYGFADVDCTPPPPAPKPEPVKPKKQSVRVKNRNTAVAHQNQAQAQIQSQAVSQSMSFGDGAFSVPQELEVFDKTLGKYHDLVNQPDFVRYSGRQGDDINAVNLPWVKRAEWTREGVKYWRHAGTVIVYPALINEDRGKIPASTKLSVVGKPSGEWLGDAYLITSDIDQNVHDVWAEAVPMLLDAGAEEVVVHKVVTKDRTTGSTLSIGLGGGLSVANNGKGQAAVSGGGGTGWSSGKAENGEIVKVTISYYRKEVK